MKYFLLILLNFIQTTLAVLIYGFFYTILRELKLNFFDNGSFINFDFIYDNFLFDNVISLFLFIVFIPFLTITYLVLIVFNTLVYFEIIKNSAINTLFYFSVIIILYCFVSNISNNTLSQLNDFMWSMISVLLTSFFINYSSKKIIKLVD